MNVGEKRAKLKAIAAYMQASALLSDRETETRLIAFVQADAAAYADRNWRRYEGAEDGKVDE